MKTRVQLAGGEHGSTLNTVWVGDLPLLSGVPGCRISLVVGDKVTAYQFRQLCIEIVAPVDTSRASGSDTEQVIYVTKVAETDKPEDA